ncbi:hypothetical protein [Veronia pacifica]|uniref:Uncharacterized protein n=1 Tax=Veronia pacifica TaxID=1080227 RepID=A0A1C3EM96_9GAMM|nr:hypothetical protein [Veronia pacifica]ODA34354.1 hypothetical protein A8L45_06415 [Veronia pacifica]
MNIAPRVQFVPAYFSNNQFVNTQQQLPQESATSLSNVVLNPTISAGYGLSTPSIHNNISPAKPQVFILSPTNYPAWSNTNLQFGNIGQNENKIDGNNVVTPTQNIKAMADDVVDTINIAIDAPFDIADNLIYRGSKTLFGLVDTPARVALDTTKVAASAVEIAGSAVVGFAKGFIQGVDNTNEDFHAQFNRDKK